MTKYRANPTVHSALSLKTNLLYDKVQSKSYIVHFLIKLLYDKVQSKRYIVHFLIKQTCSMMKYRAKAI